MPESKNPKEDYFSRVLGSIDPESLQWEIGKREPVREWTEGAEPGEKWPGDSPRAGEQIPEDLGDVFTHELQINQLRLRFWQIIHGTSPLSNIRGVSFVFGQKGEGSLADALDDAPLFPEPGDSEVKLGLEMGRFQDPDHVELHVQNMWGFKKRREDEFTETGRAMTTNLMEHIEGFLQVPGLERADHKVLRRIIENARRQFAANSLPPHDWRH